MWHLLVAARAIFMPIPSIQNIDDGKITMIIRFGPICETQFDEDAMAKDQYSGQTHPNDRRVERGVRPNEKHKPCCIKYRNKNNRRKQ